MFTAFTRVVAGRRAISGRSGFVSHTNRRNRHRRLMIESLEDRRLLSNLPPDVLPDSYRMREDTPLAVTATEPWETGLAALPSARSGMGTVAIEGLVYTAGGYASGTSAAFEAYDPLSDSWTTLPPLLQAVSGPATVALDGELYAIGGWGASVPTNAVQIYNPASNTWRYGTGLPFLSGCNQAGVIDGQIYVLTACDGYGGFRQRLDRFDPGTNSWTPLANAPQVHSGAAAGVIDGKFYVAGGGVWGAPTNALDAYDPASNTWSTLAAMPTVRDGAAGGVIGGQLYVVGGSSGEAYFDQLEVYDPASNSWSVKEAMPTARAAAGAGVVGEVLYVMGGTSSVPLSAVEAYHTVLGVLANDSDEHGGAAGENNLPLTATLETGPAHAAAFALHPDGTFSYTPAENFNGLDSFEYHAVDSLGGVSAAATVTITVDAVNDPPVAEGGPDQGVAEGGVVSFDGTGSWDPDDDVLEHHWDFGDGDAADGPTPTHVYADDGTYTVTVTVTDDDGASGVDTLTVTVTNVTPTIGAVDDQQVAEGTAVHLPPVTFTDPGTLDLHTAAIDWGDGAVQEGVVVEPTGALPGTISGSHVYADDGTYRVKVRVQDDEMAAADPDWWVASFFDVFVENVWPSNVQVELNASIINESESVTLHGSFADPGTLDTHRVTVTWGDGNNSTVDLAAGVYEFDVSHQYLDNLSGTISSEFYLGVSVIDKDFLPPVSGPPGVSNFQFGQRNWYDADGLLQIPNSSWGSFQVDVVGDPNQTLYLNVAADAGNGAAWIVQNMPVFADLTNQGGDFDIALLGVPAGTALTAMQFVATLDTSIQTAMPSGTMTAATVSAVAHHPGGDAKLGQPVLPSDVGSPAGIAIDTAISDLIEHEGVPGIQEGGSQCLAGATARSIAWLNARYNLGSAKTPQQIYADMEALNNSTVTYGAFLEGKAGYLRDMAAAAGSTAETKILTVDVNIGTPSGVILETGLDVKQWVRDELDRGEDVELDYDTHIITVTGTYDAGGKTFLKYRDDEHQGNDTAGDAGTKMGELSQDDQGAWQFRPAGSNSFFKVRLVMSESVYKTMLTVTNVPPVLSQLQVTTPIGEGGTSTLTGTIGDPSAADSFTLTIDWGDPLSPDNTQVLALGGVPIDSGGVTWDPASRAFSVIHAYLDDNPSGTAQDEYTIAVSVVDDDGGSMLPEGLISRWLAEGNADDSVDGHDGVLQGGVTFEPGWNGAGFRLDGSSGFVRVGNPPEFNFGTTGAFSLEAWFYWDGGGSSVNNILRKTAYTSDGEGYWLRINQAEQTLDFTTGDGWGGGPQGALATPVSTHVWHHAVGVRDDAGLMALYLDGELKGSVAAPGTDTTGIGIFLLGAWEDLPRYAAHEFFSGVIDEAAVYGRALSSAEVEARYHGAAALLTVTVQNLPPSITVDPQTATVAEGQTFTLNQATFLDPGVLDTHTATIDWGDGAVESGSVVEPAGSEAGRIQGSHAYADDGAYTVTVTVQDDEGGEHSETLVVTVTNVAPTLGGVAVTTPIDEGDTAHLTGSITDPGIRDEFTLVVDWGDGTAAETFALPAGTTLFDQTHVYADNATDPYTITVTLEDDAADLPPAWTELTPTGSLPMEMTTLGVWEPHAVYHPTIQRMLVFGGHLGNTLTELNQVLALDHADGLSGTPAWREVAALADPSFGLPAPRTHHDYVYDSANNRLIVFGGNTNRGYCDGAQDTSLWILLHADGTTGTAQWVKVSPSGAIPPARHQYTLDYDPLTNRMILYGGSVACPGSGGYFDDLWVLENANGLGGTPGWTQLMASGAPAGRMAHSAAYDMAHNRLMVYGGFTAAGGVEEFWILEYANGLDRATGLPATPTWTQLAPLDDPAYPAQGKPSWNSGAIGSHSPVYDADRNQLVLFDAAAGIVGDVSDDLWVLENANGLNGTPQWQRLSPTETDPGTRRYHSAVYDDELDRMVIFAGYRDDSSSPTDVWALDVWPQAKDTATVSVTVENVAPTIANVTQNGPVEIGSPVTVTITASDPAGDRDPLTYEWDFDGDGTYEVSRSEPSAQHVYADSGTFPVAVRVTDDDGDSATSSTDVTVYLNEPSASFTAIPNPCACNQTVSFDASGSSHGHPDRTITRYEWDFDYVGGSFDLDGEGVVLGHAFPQFGVFTVALRLTDDNEPPKTDVTTLVVTVNQGNRPPEADAGGPYTIAVGEDLTLDASGSSDPDEACGDQVVSYRWDLDGDGEFDVVTVDPVVTIAWNELADEGVMPGSFEIVLRVTDAFDATDDDVTAGAILAVDFGDAPDPTYPTLLASDGARHVIVSGFHLGALIDGEGDGQPSASADGDDLNGLADEDGVVPVSFLIPGQLATLSVTVTDASGSGGFVDAWIDADRDGSFTTWPMEQFLVSRPVTAGMNLLTFPLPLLVSPGPAYVRFRLSSTGGLKPHGLAADGEVEDYQVMIEERTDIKWMQEPDLMPTGIDVRMDNSDGLPRVLADDFPCTEPGLLTDVHFWGSWLGDVKTEISTIHLSIHSDDPVGPGGSDPDNPFSKPDQLLWQADFGAGQFLEQPVEFVEQGEWFWDSHLGAPLFPGDFTVYEYDIQIDPALAFEQLGTPENPLVYWLDIRVETLAGQAQFGWKTRALPDHFNDDAVCGVDGGQWEELRYPPGHPYEGQSIDLAFALTFTPQQELDFGDAPDPTYPTLLASNGARHVIVPGFHLGNTIDADPDGQPDRYALGDNHDGNIDEDGVFFTTSLIPGQVFNLAVQLADTAGAGGVLDAWFDWDQNGDWAGPGERVFASQPLASGNSLFPVLVPANASIGYTVSRFRLSRQGVASYIGVAPDGEVEDYMVLIKQNEGLDFGDAPDPSYPTWSGSIGAVHSIVPGLHLGAGVDFDFDGQPDPQALGDDNVGNDDEDGVRLLTRIVPGTTARVEVIATAPGLLNAWLDLNADGDWDDGGEHFTVDLPLVAGANVVPLVVPANAVVTPSTFARFRFSTQAGLDYRGWAADGEVEDYEVSIQTAVRHDIAGRTSSGRWYVAASTGTSFSTTYWGLWGAGAWTDVLAGDFNGDGQADVVGRLNNRWYVGLNTGTSFVTTYWGLWGAGAWIDVLVGDFNGDGRDDIAGRLNNRWYVAASSGTTFTTTYWGLWGAGTWTDVLVGDFNGDGKSDIAGRLNGTRWYVAASTGTSFSTTYWALWGAGTWTNVLVGDFDADGRSDITARLNGNRWYTSLSTGTSFNTTYWGLWGAATWNDVGVGDFDGDGRSDIAGRLNDGRWYVGLSTGASYSTTYWGLWGAATWNDVGVGDFDGDGRSDIAGRLNDGRWYVARSDGSKFSNEYWGLWDSSLTWLDVLLDDFAP